MTKPRSLVDPTQQEEIKKLSTRLNDLPRPMKFDSLLQLLKENNARLDKAKSDPMSNIKAIMILSAYVNKCENVKALSSLTLLLGEEDLNLTLLVNVENAIRKRFSDCPISLQAEIKATLNNVLKATDEYATDASINQGIKAYVAQLESKQDRGPLLYNIITRKEFKMESKNPLSRLITPITTAPASPSTGPSTPITSPSSSVTEPSTPISSPSSPKTEPSTPLTSPTSPTSDESDLDNSSRKPGF